MGSVGTWGCEYHEEGTWLILDVGGEVVAHGANLHICHVAQVQHTAAAGAQHDVIKLLDTLQCTLVLHGVLVGVFRKFTQGTHTCHEALSANGIEDIVRCQVILCHNIRFQPYTQSIGVTQTLHVTDARYTHQARLDVDIDVVRYEVFIVLTVSTLHGENLQDVVLALLHLHADFVHVGRQQSLCAGYAVLHVHCCHIWVGALLEVDVDFHFTV